MRTLRLIVLLIVSTLFSYSQSFNAKVIGITDGDTVKVLKLDSTTVKIRLVNIDCPERKQAFSTKAKQFTSDAVFSKNVRIEVIKTDRYGRLVANIIYDQDLNLSKELLKAGLAWHYQKYSNDASLQQLEDEARAQKIGLWSDPHAIAPWQYRSNKKYKQ
ncbi:thermonuclease family protein [Winogradskyella aurantiaca]|uniref:thermonuclease family protein n=1 Tax=Winogradskyella aurantiaca TaxID=2219558 RepID=UPI000E1C9ABC|nr:thermonuclease family protein [Winogradskyella aurantiaca]